MADIERPDSEAEVPPNVFLEVIEGEQKGEKYSINRKSVTIGRESVCDIQLEDTYISKRHCQLVFRNDHFTIIDLGSTNKTKVDDKVYVQKNLKDGNIITLGKTVLRFIWAGCPEDISAEGDICCEPEDDSLSIETGE
jgi:pSer/pThr/pTyr-binding forkhead associated (FHA) protein